MIVIEKNGRIIMAYSGLWQVKNGDLYVNGQKVMSPVMGVIHEVPDQDLSHLYTEDGISGVWPDDVPLQYSPEELVQIKIANVDLETEEKIDTKIHPTAPIGEQIGILRDQLVHVLNALGIEPTEEFAKLNEIAIKEIEAAREKKEALNGQDNSA